MKNALHLATDHGQEIPNDLPAPNETDPALLSRPSARRGRGEENAPSVADQLIAIAEAHVCEWIRDGAPDKGEAYARVPAPQEDGDGATSALYPLHSKAFKRWLNGFYYSLTQSGPSMESINTALATLQSRALFGKDAKEVTINLRVAGDHETIDIDIGDNTWRMVRITRDGWSIITHREGNRYFVRSASTEALPIPRKGGTFSMLRPYIGLADARHNDAWALLASCLVMMLWPTGKYPLLAFIGEQGSGKTTALERARSIVDPNTSPHEKPPRKIEDLYLRARSSRVIGLDNLSAINADLADALCRLATGAGYNARQLYTDTDEIVFHVRRSVMLTAITDVIQRADLLDRAVTVSLPIIPLDQRKTSEEMDQAFEQDRPLIFGALLDALSLALREYPLVRAAQKELPRMADYAVVAQAAESAYGVEHGTWKRAYAAMCNDAHDRLLEEPLPRSIITLMSERDTWDGTPTELFTTLRKIAGIDGIPSHKSENDWPRSVNAFSGVLKRLMPSLRTVGIEVMPNGRGNDYKRTRSIGITKKR